MHQNRKEKQNVPSYSGAQQEFVNPTLMQFAQWLERYFDAWRSNEPADVIALFAEDAIYHYGPFVPPIVGRQAIVRRWVANPGQQQDIQTSYEPLAVNKDLGIAHWRVTFRRAHDPSTVVEADGILAIKFDRRLLCTEHREWFLLREVR